MNLEENIFEKTISNSPALYHFLDGYINPETGSSSDIVYRFLGINNQIYPKELNSYVIYTNMNNKTISLKDWIKYSDFHSDLLDFASYKNDFTYSFEKKIFIDINDMEVDVSDIFIEKLSNMMILVGLDNHSTSLYFFILDDILYVMSINSGQGIQNHKKYTDAFSMVDVNMEINRILIHMINGA